jgi:PAS domain S-box-containing protein
MKGAAGPDAPPQRGAHGRSGRLGAEIERIAQMGSWEWDIPTDSITWSEGLFRLYGLEPGLRSTATYHEYVSLLHPDDRERIQHVIAESRRTGEPFVHVHRIVRPTGEVRTLLGRGEIVRGDDGQSVRMVGTAQDVTERMQIEREIAARLAAEAAAERSQFLADVGEALAASSLHYEQTLRRVASLSVPRVADWCAIDLVHDDGELRRVAMHHTDPEMQGPAPDGPTITAPLVGRDGPFGTITFANDAARGDFDDADRHLAEDLGRRAGIAIENARLYEMVRESQAQLEEQAAELQAQTVELEAATARTGIAYDELRVTAEALLRRTDEAEASRREITSILESIGDGFYAVDESWRFTYVNERAEKLLQRTRGELVGRVLWAEFPEAVGTIFQTVYRRVMESRVAERFETYFAPLDLWCDVSAFPALTGGMAVYFHDITVRRRGEIQFGTLAETMPQLVWSTTGDGYHDYYNSRWYEYTGMPREGAQGWNWKNFLHPDDYGRTVEQWKQSLVSGEPYSIEYRFRQASTG